MSDAVIDTAFGQGWAVGLLVVLILGISGFISLYFTKVVIPRNQREEKLADARNAREQRLADEARTVLQNVSQLTERQVDLSRALADHLREVKAELESHIQVLMRLVEQHESPDLETNTFQTVTTNRMLHKQLEIVELICDDLLNNQTPHAHLAASIKRMLQD